MNKNKWGYKKGSPFANEPYIDIQGNDITMEGVPHNVLAIPDNDKPLIMKPGGKYLFKNSSKVREIPLYQQGGMAEEIPISPFIDLEKFINTYKLKKQFGGVIDYMKTLPEEQQYSFARDFETFDKETQTEIGKYLKGGYYQRGGYYPEPYKPFMSLKDNLYYDPYRSQIVKRDSKTGAYTKSDKDVKVDKTKVKSFLNQVESETISPETVFGKDFRYATPEETKQIEKVWRLRTAPTKTVVAKLGSVPKNYDYATLMKKAKVDNLIYLDEKTGKPALQYGAKDIGVEDLSDADYMEEIVAGTSRGDVYTKQQSQDIKNVRINVGIPKEMFDFGPTPYGRYTPGEKQINIRKDVDEGTEPRVHRKDVLAHEIKHYDDFNWYLPNQVDKKNLKYLSEISNVSLPGDLLGEELPAYNAGLRSYLYRNNPQYNNVANPITLNDAMWLFNVQEDETIDLMKSIYKSPETMMNYMNKYRTGGTIKTFPEVNKNLANAEVERGESAVINNELVKFGGQPHSSGGTPVRLPNGSRIYSEHLIVPKELASQVLGKKVTKKMSYADISKKFPTKPYLDILEKSDDEYQLNTAELKLANNLSKLDTLFFAQEQVKNKEKNKERNKERKDFQRGGEVSNINWLTGEVDSEYQFNMTPQEWLTYITNKNQPIKPTEPQNWKSNPNLLPFQILTPDLAIQEEQEEPEYTVPNDLFLQMPNRKNPVAYGNKEFIKQDKQNEQLPISPALRSKQFKPSSKRTTKPNNIVLDASKTPPIPLPFEQLSPISPTVLNTNTLKSNTLTPFDIADIMVETNTKAATNSTPSVKAIKREDSQFGISSKLAGTVADIGLALSDRLRVSEPSFYDRRKYPLFTRFVDFDDKEVQRMYDKNIQQVQNSNLPEQVKQAQISELTSKYQDYQAKVDYGNLQRYEDKRERDTDKLQKYTDYNVDQKVADIESYREKKARVDYLRDQFKSQRKSRVVNSLKAYADYADKINLTNEFTPNYKINPISGKINYKAQEKSDLTQNILQQYQQSSNNRIDLGSGATGRIVGNIMIITDKDGKITTAKIE